MAEQGRHLQVRELTITHMIREAVDYVIMGVSANPLWLQISSQTIAEVLISFACKMVMALPLGVI